MVHAMMRWWVDRGVDGFRMDVINLISRDPSLPDGPVPPGWPVRGVVRAVAQRPAAEEYAEMNREVGLAGGQPAHRRGDARLDRASWPDG